MNAHVAGRRFWLPACWLAALAGCHSAPAGHPVNTGFTSRMIERPAYRIAQFGSGEGMQYQRCLAGICPVATPKTPVPELRILPERHAEAGVVGGVRANVEPASDVFLVHFASGSARLDTRARRALEVVARSGLEQGIVVAGRTDNQGGNAANARLAQARAESVVAYLRTKPQLAQAAMRIDARPRCCDLMDNASAAGRAANRRAEISALSTEGGQP